MLPVYGEKCLSRKVVQNLVEKFSKGRSKVADDAHRGVEVAETTVKRLLCRGFRRTGKAMGTGLSVLVEDMSRNKYFFQVRMSRFAFYIHLWPIY
jgi:hypothetical protein